MIVTETVIILRFRIPVYQQIKITLFMAREEILVHSHNQKSHEIGII